jgi:hypothetical protein
MNHITTLLSSTLLLIFFLFTGCDSTTSSELEVDTVNITDTVSDTIRISDTVIKTDSITLYDSLFVHDTLFVIDTQEVYVLSDSTILYNINSDTGIVLINWNFSLYYRGDSWVQYWVEGSIFNNTESELVSKYVTIDFYDSLDLHIMSFTAPIFNSSSNITDSKFLIPVGNQASFNSELENSGFEFTTFDIFSVHEDASDDGQLKFNPVYESTFMNQLKNNEIKTVVSFTNI